MTKNAWNRKTEVAAPGGLEPGLAEMSRKSGRHSAQEDRFANRMTLSFTYTSPVLTGAQEKTNARRMSQLV
jgi:hypothetical protein